MGLGMPEVVLILVIALIVFGPRKLPELGKSLGQAMAQFRRASDDFKRTWEQEVDLEKSRVNSSQDYSTYGSSGEPHEVYNPYASEPETQQLASANDEHAVDSTTSPEKPTEAAAATAAGTSEKQHWI